MIGNKCVSIRAEIEINLFNFACTNSEPVGVAITLFTIPNNYATRVTCSS
jgi:hypothetical protein